MLECVKEREGEADSEHEGMFESNLSLVMFLKLVSGEKERTKTGKTTLSPVLHALKTSHNICL